MSDTIKLTDLEKLIDDRARRLVEQMKDAQIAHGDTGGRQSNPHDHDPPVSTPAAPAPPHKMRSWEKTCPDCGLENSEYKEPDLVCDKPECGYPMGNLPSDFKLPGPGEKAELPTIRPCSRCGNVNARPVKR